MLTWLIVFLDQIYLTAIVHTVNHAYTIYFRCGANIIANTQYLWHVYFQGKTYYPTLLRTHNQIAECRGRRATLDQGPG